MLDVLDFIKERGGDPDKVRASQRKRFAPESVVDEVKAAGYAGRVVLANDLDVY